MIEGNQGIILNGNMALRKCLTLDERRRIESMYNAGSSVAEIGYRLNRCVATIYRELDRCPKGKYKAEQSNKDARKRKTFSKKHGMYQDIEEIKNQLLELSTLIKQVISSGYSS